MIERASPPTVPLDDVLHRTSDEILRCRDIVVQIETTVHALMDEGVTLPAAARAELQAIDLLDQRLADLALWLQSLGVACAGVELPHPVASLLHELRLADLRHALAGRSVPPPPDGSRRPSAADLPELF